MVKWIPSAKNGQDYTFDTCQAFALYNLFQIMQSIDFQYENCKGFQHDVVKQIFGFNLIII